MTKITLKVFIILILLPVTGIGQKRLSLEDASGQNPSLNPALLRNLQWQGIGNDYSWQDGNLLIIGTAKSHLTDTLRPLPDINKSLAGMGKDTLKKLPAVNWTGKSGFWFLAGNTLYSFDLVNSKLNDVNHFPSEASDFDIEPKTMRIAYTIGNNLHIASGGEQVQVTSDTDPGLVNGQIVHRNEFGINKGTFWSPTGRYLAYYHKDETMVTDYPLVDVTQRIAKASNIKYPMAGMQNEKVTLVVYDTREHSSTTMQTGDNIDQYLTCVTWDPAEKFVFIGLLNRDQNHLQVNRYSSETGKFDKTLFEEHDNKYVEPEHPLYFLRSRPDRFIWISERDGFQHLYLYDTGGTLIRQLTRGEWVVTSFLGTDQKDKKAFFTSTQNSPLNEDLFYVDMDKGTLHELSVNPGTHYPLISDDGKYYIDIYSDSLAVREYVLAETKGRVTRYLHRANNPFSTYGLGKMKIFSLEGTDSAVLFSRMIYPPDFDPAKKYPVIIYVYGGPHSQLISNSWLGGASLFLYYLAQQGYLVFTLDNRGSSDRGRDFEQAIFRDLGTKETEDQMTGVKYLTSLPYVDADRIGLNGWSYGGFMTLSLMLREPEVFRAGACGGPVTDWQYYEVMYGERYMDTPETNMEGYFNASLLNRAARLNGKLLIIHGTEDPTVVWQQSLLMVDRFIKEGKQVDYFVYPGHGHGVGGKDRLHLNRKMAEYFKENL